MSDRELLAETRRIVEIDRRTTAELLALLGEVDARKLYRGEGYSSLFTYCTQALHLSEPSAYSRITAARAARKFPVILRRLANGDVTLTTITLLAAHLTDENHEVLLEEGRHKGKRDVERLVAALDPTPDIEASIRRRPTPIPTVALLAVAVDAVPPVAPRPGPPPTAVRQSKPPVIAPLAPARYLVKFTVSQDTHDKLQRARDLLRHSIPNGDPAAVIDRALTVLVAQLEKTRFGSTRQPRTASGEISVGRHVPAAVKRAVCARDQGRCAFVGTDGRCRETGFLEFHHVAPFAVGGATSVENLQLRCRSHNAHEAELFFGPDAATLSGQSSDARGGILWAVPPCTTSGMPSDAGATAPASR